MAIRDFSTNAYILGKSDLQKLCDLCVRIFGGFAING